MFPTRYFANRMYAPRYFPKVGDALVVLDYSGGLDAKRRGFGLDAKSRGYGLDAKERGYGLNLGRTR